jgi:hypothetical protein
VAEHFTAFSFAVAGITDAEHEWLASLLAVGEDGSPSPELAGLLTNPPFVGFSAELQDDGSLWLYSEEAGVPEDAAAVVQAFLGRFRPDASVAFEWANTCSRPELDSFGGGAVVISADHQQWMSSAQWLAGRSVAGGGGLRSALAEIDANGFGENVDADAVVKHAAEGLLALYDAHRLGEVGHTSAADQCADLYRLLSELGLVVG